LGCQEADPKRAHLTPKVIVRWVKFLYITPALFPIYFKAAAKAAASYPPYLKARIRRERHTTIAVHCAAMALLFAIDLQVLIKLHTLPYFFVFPVVFTLNRLGQHYSIDPADPAHWTSLIRGNFFWDFAYLYSNYHLEHHYFPRVPCYNLPELQKLLAPLYQRHQMAPTTYVALLYGWFVQNRTPHANWG
jgi:fatty acid desaturase